MPIIYISAKSEIELNVQYENILKAWTSKKLRDERRKYNHPFIMLWFSIENLDDPISPFTFIITDKDIYEGNLGEEHKGKKFKIIFNGKAKVFIHKRVKVEIDRGRIPYLTCIDINGQGFQIEPFDTNLKINTSILR